MFKDVFRQHNLALALSGLSLFCIPSASYADFKGIIIEVSPRGILTVQTSQRAVPVKLSNVVIPSIEHPEGSIINLQLKDQLLLKTVIVQTKKPINTPCVIADVYLNGQNLNHSLVAQGLAWSDSPQYEPEVNGAKLRKLGMWASGFEITNPNRSYRPLSQTNYCDVTRSSPSLNPAHDSYMSFVNILILLLVGIGSGLGIWWFITNKIEKQD